MLLNKSTLDEWNNSTDWYDKNMGEHGDRLNSEIIKPLIIEKFKFNKQIDVLDVGCGSGYLTNEISKIANTVIGTDFSPNFIKLCKSKYKNTQNLSFKVQDVNKKFEFEDLSFDIVLCKMVLQYIKNIDNFAPEAYRILKNDGKLMIVVDHPFHSQYYYAQKMVGVNNKKYKNLNNYFSEKPVEKLSLWGKVQLTWYPKTIEKYITTFLNVGFSLSDFKELPEKNSDTILPRILYLEFTKT